MSGRGTYKTKQHDEILNYIKTIEGEHFNVCDIYDHFKEEGQNIGTATIYRQLEKLVDEGNAIKYTLDPGTPACFEYVNPGNHLKRKTCFHLRCEICGRLTHMNCGELQGLASHLENEHGFRINAMRTVFYGICSDCQNAEEE